MPICYKLFYICLQAINEPMKPTNTLIWWCDIMGANEVANLLYELDRKTTGIESIFIQ